MKRRSPIWNPTKEDFAKLVKDSSTFSEVLAHFGLTNKGGNHTTIKARIQEDGVNAEHLWENASLSRVKTLKKHKPRATPLVEILTNPSLYNRGHLKRRLIGEGLLENKCSACEQTTAWFGAPLVMVLDHINGNPKDNRLGNLRLLCPNCNSQTSTFAGRNKKVTYSCPSCGKPIHKTSQRCRTCEGKARIRKTKIDWPPTPDLLQLVRAVGYSGAGKQLGVSDNAVRKRVKAHS